MDSLMVAEIKQTLYRNFQLEFSVEEIRQLTLEALISLGENKNTVLPKKVEQETPKAQSIILTEEAVVTLNEHPNCDKIVFFVHPVEGRVDAMRTLAKWTKATVYGFQCTRKSDYDTIPDLARHFIEVLKEKQSKGPYSICGYSYGVILAMEIALQLEEQGEEVNLVFIDGSVEFAKNVSRMIVESKIDSLKEVCETFVGIHRDEFANIVAGTWEEALRDVSTVVATKLGMDWDLINCSIVQYYNRGRAAFFYEPKGKLRGRVTLVRTLCDNPYTSAYDYGLQELCQKKVDVVMVNGNHYTIVLEENAKAVSEIINRTLI
nr:fatty acid synthase-like [Leptinotarsa decemlineata]